MTLGSLFAIFEPWIWRRLGPVPACLKLCKRKIESRLRHAVDDHDKQFGFRRGRGTTDAIFNLRIPMQKLQKKEKEQKAVSVDLEKTYDTVTRNLVRYCLRRRKVPDVYIHNLQDLYRRSERAVGSRRGTRLLNDGSTSQVLRTLPLFRILPGRNNGNFTQGPNLGCCIRAT